MEQLFDEYMYVWKQMQYEKQKFGKPSAETIARLKECESNINHIKKGH